MMRKKFYFHYVWQPIALYDFHLFVFDYAKVRTDIVWRDAFHSKNPKSKYEINYGYTYTIKDHSITNVAVSLMKSEDDSIDISYISHECTHAADEIFQLYSMKFGVEYSTHEFRAYIVAGLVSKICQILIHEGIKLSFDHADNLGLLNVVKIK